MPEVQGDLIISMLLAYPTERKHHDEAAPPIMTSVPTGWSCAPGGACRYIRRRGPADCVGPGGRQRVRRLHGLGAKLLEGGLGGSARISQIRHNLLF